MGQAFTFKEHAVDYPTLLLTLGDDERAAARLDQASHLARRFESHLVGLSCRRPVLAAPVGPAAMLGADALTLELSQAASRATAREASFRAYCMQARLRSHELVCDDAEPAAAVVQLAAVADLVVLGQAEPDDPSFDSQRKLVDDVLLRCARPTLLLPYIAGPAKVGTTVLVAWDGSHGAARAATDALPFLRGAQAVHLVRFADRALDDEATAEGSVNAAAAWLSRQGVHATTHSYAATIPVGDALLSTAADVGADLLVMGAWGHSRFVERMLGGATRIVTDSMTLPVLLSH